MNPFETPQPDDDALAAEYALGTLPHGERVAFERRIADDRALRDRVMWWQEQFQPMGDGVAPVAPPQMVKAALEARLFPAVEANETLWQRVGFWRGLTALSFAGMLVMAALLVGRAPGPEPDTLYVAAIAGEASDLRVAALFNPADGFLRLSRTAGEAASGRDLELWLIAGDNPPVSLGTFPEDRAFALELTASLRQAVEAGAVLAVSDEPDGGSPTGQPTGAVLGVGAVTQL